MSEVIEKTASQVRHEAHQAARESLIEDLGRRREGAKSQLLQRRQQHAAKMAEIRRDAHAGRPDNHIAVLYAEARDIDAAIRKIESGDLPDLEREFQSINGGFHPKLTVFTHAAAVNLAAEKSKAYEDALANFRIVLSPEVVAAAKLVVTTHTAMLITPPAVAVAIADSNI